MRGVAPPARGGTRRGARGADRARRAEAAPPVGANAARAPVAAGDEHSAEAAPPPERDVGADLGSPQHATPTERVLQTAAAGSYLDIVLADGDEWVVNETEMANASKLSLLSSLSLSKIMVGEFQLITIKMRECQQRK